MKAYSVDSDHEDEEKQVFVGMFFWDRLRSYVMDCIQKREWFGTTTKGCAKVCSKVDQMNGYTVHWDGQWRCTSNMAGW